MKVVHGSVHKVRGNTYYVNPKDLAESRRLKEWVAFDPRKHRHGDFEHVKANAEDLERIFPDELGPHALNEDHY